MEAGERSSLGLPGCLGSPLSLSACPPSARGDAGQDRSSHTGYGAKAPGDRDLLTPENQPGDWAVGDSVSAKGPGVWDAVARLREATDQMSFRVSA